MPRRQQPLGHCRPASCLYSNVMVNRSGLLSHYVYPDVIEPGALYGEAGPMPASPAFQQALGLAVKHRREELGLTQEELHLRSELHQRWISNVETGKRNPSYASLRRLAAALDLSTSELLARAEQIEADEVSGLKTPAATTG